MGHIDEKYKEVRPEQTVERIKNILDEIGIHLEEKWYLSGIDNCWSLCVFPEGGFPTANGKGVSQELARASAYGEFMERLQSGLFFYKYQSIERDAEMDLQSFAPDARYMTMQELEENGEWMDHIIQTYGGTLTRKKIAQQCKIYACVEDDRILTIPFYSLFEDKYVYLPVAFIEHMYSANGCCAGNSREEAWVHALSEIMERRGSISTMLSGQAVPRIPDEVLNQFPTVTKILAKIRENEKFDVQVFDFSGGSGFPVIATRIINKDTKGYVVDTGADPILEIAVQRTLTEIFQGRNLDTFNSAHSGPVLSKIDDFLPVHNVLNLLETANGLFAADFFAEELTCQRECTKFDDNSDKNNKQLLESMLERYRATNKPVYVRNYSFLGFHCYKFIVPGFSESRGLRLNQKISEYALGDEAAKTLKNPMVAMDDELGLLLMFHKQMKTAYSRYYNFGRLAGLPIVGPTNSSLLYITMSYAAYRMKNYTEAIRYLDSLLRNSDVDEHVKAYFSCVQQYLRLKAGNTSDDKIRVIINKFSRAKYSDMLYHSLENGGTPYDEFLLKCDHNNCSACQYKSVCHYEESKKMIASAGQVYKTFADGQNRKEFLLD